MLVRDGGCSISLAFAYACKWLRVDMHVWYIDGKIVDFTFLSCATNQCCFVHACDQSDFVFIVSNLLK